MCAIPQSAPLVFNLHGASITLSNALWQSGVRNAETLRDFIRAQAPHRLTFGVVFPFSPHAYYLRLWLRKAGINPDTEIRLAIVPPPQMFSNLRSGNLDGYCVGDPWNTLAVQNQAGWCPTVSAELDPSSPDKVLMTRSSFVHQRQAEHLAMVAALIDAAVFCDHPKNREELIRIIAQPRYLDIPAKTLRNTLYGKFDCGHGRFIERDDLILFHRHQTNAPHADKATRIMQQVRGCGALLPTQNIPDHCAQEIFRADLYAKALHLNHQKQTKYETNIAPRKAVLA